ncbi:MULTISPECIES: hypothetical protein [Flammeovirga]|uniref:Uncharacterized protein n=1 Tax=Flammeovirga agarivorans TaxID=2726742 RepID=A0A7X8XVQ9_9BACT|nr:MULTISPECIES: hypothetical protein [Flammeovirga]NLR91577.1 hypothetical protein [Flammeovirga agarivorans]
MKRLDYYTSSIVYCGLLFFADKLMNIYDQGEKLLSDTFAYWFTLVILLLATCVVVGLCCYSVIRGILSSM